MTANGFRDQVAVVTGGARGIGLAIARRLAADGGRVVVWDRDLAPLAGSGFAPDAAEAVDVTDYACVERAFKAAVARFGQVHILVNNAGVNGLVAPAEDYPDAGWRKVMSLNIDAPFCLSREIGKRAMLPRRSGKIINLGSQAGTVALPGASVYCMTKAAVSHPTKCLAVEWGKYNINVNCVAPTYIRTPGTMGWGLDEFVERTHLLSKLPLGRVGEPIEVSGTVVFLASPAAALITGATLLIDAGYTAL